MDENELRIFRDETAAYALVEKLVWPDGPVCTHCGGTTRIGRLGGQSTHVGTYKCYVCRKPFNVRTGTLFENSNIPLAKWLQAIHLLLVNEEIRQCDLSAALGVTAKTSTALRRKIRQQVLALIPPEDLAMQPAQHPN